MTVSEEKAALRSRIRAERRGISEEERKLAALRVAERLVLLDEVAGAGVVLAYMPMKYELDILPAVELLKARGVRAAFPLCIENGGLRLFIPSEKDGFKVGAYGILEPNVETAEEISVSDLGAIILPAVGFDREGFRLGQGGGYYDRLLARSDCFCAAVGFDCQLVDKVPTEETDMPVNVVVTPSHTLVIR